MAPSNVAHCQLSSLMPPWKVGHRGLILIKWKHVENLDSEVADVSLFQRFQEIDGMYKAPRPWRGRPQAFWCQDLFALLKVTEDPKELSLVNIFEI